MAHFTQLNLQGNSGKKSETTPSKTTSQMDGAAGRQPQKHGGTAKIAIGGSLAAAALVTALMLGTNACSKSNRQTIAAPTSISPAATQPVAAMPAPTSSQTMPAPAAKPAKKARPKHILFAYKNADYGISFLYPKEYKMKKGGKAKLEWAGLGPVELNFIQPGGTTLAAVELPQTMFPETNFASGFLEINVNPKLTADQCAGFAFEDESQTAAGASAAEDEDWTAPKPKDVKFGVTEFTEADSSGGDAAKHADAKYYHVYENGACYEFALGVETADLPGNDGTNAVDTNAVFHKLNWMLSTVKISDLGAQGKAAPAMASTVPDTSKATPESPATTGETNKNATTATAANTGKN